MKLLYYGIVQLVMLYFVSPPPPKKNFHVGRGLNPKTLALAMAMTGALLAIRNITKVFFLLELYRVFFGKYLFR